MGDNMNTPARQQGMALVMGLIILLVMTLISVSAMRSTLMQERMAGSFQGSQLAFQAAEAALKRAERHISGSSIPDFGINGFYQHGNPNRDRPDWADPDAPITGSDAPAVETYTEDLGENVAHDPQYYIVRLPVRCTEGDLDASGAVDRNSFRLVARGFGANENSQAVLESYYCR